MSRFWLVPLIVLAIVLLGLLALGIPSGAPAPTAYEKPLDVKAN